MAFSESSLIRDLLRPIAGSSPESLALLDDAALLPSFKGQGVIAADTIVEDVHFLPSDSPADVAYKLLGVNLSDMAAMGAKPVGIVCSFSFSPSKGADWAQEFVAGLKAAVEEFGLRLLGGDTVFADGPISLSVTMLGDVTGNLMTRSGAKPGDILCVTGSLGDAALGLQSLLGKLPDLPADPRTFLEDRYHRPQARLDMGASLAAFATACMDVSDGIEADIRKMAEASDIGFELRCADLPLSEAAKTAIRLYPACRDLPLSGGDDYELLFTMPSSLWPSVRFLSEKAGLPVTQIGVVTSRPSVIDFLDGEGQLYSPSQLGYDHRL